jgi:hypothetical protein
MRHKHADLIIEWANGAEIEIRRNKDEPWEKTEAPKWFCAFEYRIKPEPKPDVVLEYYVRKNGHAWERHMYHGKINLKLTLDGETGELKSAEVMT